MTYVSPFNLTIRSTEAGNYTWTLHHGPDGAFVARGTSKKLERCFELILQAQKDLAESLTAP